MASTTYRFGPRSMSVDVNIGEGSPQEVIDGIQAEVDAALKVEFATEVARSYLKAQGPLFGSGPIAIDGPGVNQMIETMLTQYLTWLNTEGFISDENFITKE